MSETAEITAEEIKGKTIEQLNEEYGPATTVEFILDDNVSEFRVGLLNEFARDQTANGGLILHEVTFSLNEEDNLTVWYHGSDYVRHMVYGKMADFWPYPPSDCSSATDGFPVASVPMLL